jgi:sugar/nucleoside kinase (ribokinase family)
VSPSVTVLGDAHLDVRVVPAAAVRSGSDVPATIELGPGGQGANVAVRLARRGVPVELVAALAADPAGSLVRQALEAEGVALHAIEVEDTGTAVVLGDRDGERTMYSHRAPFLDRIEPPSPSADGWLVVSGYLLHEPVAIDVARRLAALPVRRVLLGCAVPDDLAAGWRAAAHAMRADLWILNHDELRRLGPAGAAGVAVTDARGATVSVGGVRADSRTPTGAPARDTTGAGDAFAAALIDVLRGLDWPPAREGLEDAVEEAVALASRVARVAGAQGRVDGERPATLIR